MMFVFFTYVSLTTQSAVLVLFTILLHSVTFLQAGSRDGKFISHRVNGHLESKQSIKVKNVAKQNAKHLLESSHMPLPFQVVTSDV